MSRLIDADALLGKAWDAENGFGWEKVVSVNDVMTAPTVGPMGWTPCSERLPETTKWRTSFMVTVECDSWGSKKKTLSAELENTTVRGKPVSRWIWNNRLFPAEWTVVAWMPMPAPYKGGEADDTAK